MPGDPIHPYVSRGGLKLRHALDTFGVNPSGWRCADFGCSVGGFTDCLLQAGAAHVTAVDTAYGMLAWKLRQDPRVHVWERSNALHVPPPAEADRVDLVVIDMGWTPQRLCVPAALKWLRAPREARSEGSPPPNPLPVGGGVVITLIKPHYELDPHETRTLLRGGILDESEAGRVTNRVIEQMPTLGVAVLGLTRSPIAGSKEKSRGNTEWLALLAPVTKPI